MGNKHTKLKRFLALGLTVAMVLQQTGLSSIAEEPAGETAVVETVETQTPETVVPETTAPETKAPETVVSEETLSVADEEVTEEGNAVVPEETVSPENEETAAPEETASPEDEETAAPEETTSPKEEEAVIPEETPSQEVTEAPEETPSQETTAAPEETSAAEAVVPEGISVLAVPETDDEAADGGIMPMLNRAASKDLKDFLVAANISGDVRDENGNLVLQKGREYSVYLKFSEDGNKLSFLKNGEELTYTFPNELTPAAESGTFEMEFEIYGKKYTGTGNTYRFEGNTLYIKFSEETLGYLNEVENGGFEVSLKATVTGEPGSTGMQWSDSIEATDVVITNEASVTVSKEGEYDEETGRFKFEIKVKAAGEPENIVVTDIIEGSLLTIDEDAYGAEQPAVAVSSNKGRDISWDIVKGNINADKKGFTATISEMSDGEEITFAYYTDINYDGITKDSDGSFKFTQGQTKNTVTAEFSGVSDSKSWDFGGKKAFDSTPEKSGRLSGGVTADDEQIINWTVTVNKDAKQSIAGKKITDTLVPNPDAPTKYCGDGITIEVYELGNEEPIEVRNIPWKDVLKPGESPETASSWTYTVPSKDKAYKYVITYQTVTDVSGLVGTWDKVENDIKIEDQERHGSVNVGPVGAFDVTKDYFHVTKDGVQWEIYITIPKTGFNDYFTVTDTLPSAGSDDNRVYDSLKKGTLKVRIQDIDGSGNVTGQERTLVEGEDYTVNTSKTGEFTIEFNKISTLFPRTSKDRKMTIIYSVDHAADWPAGVAHVNKVTVNADGHETSGKNEYTYEDRSISKAYLSESTVKDATGQVDLPVYKFRLRLTGVNSEKITIEDIFDDSILEYYEFESPEKSDKYTYVAGLDNSSKVGDYSEAKESGGVNLNGVSYADHKLTITVPKKRDSDKSYYQYYWVDYFLKVKDKDALVELEQKAVDSGEGKVVLTNTVSWEIGSPQSADVTYEVHPLSKELTEGAKGNNNYIATYKIIINPNGLQLNSGHDIAVEDTFTESMQLVPGSLTVRFNGEDQGSYPYTPKGKGFELSVPDGTPVELEYQVKIVGSGGKTVEYSNSVLISGNYGQSTGTEEVKITSTGSGGGSTQYLYIYKHDAENENLPLEGAKFQLYEVKEGMAKEIDGAVFETGADGRVRITGSDGLRIGNTYELREIAAPDGYVKLKNPIRFTYTGTTTGEEGVYSAGDLVSIANAETKVSISKLDVTNNKELPGATIQILDENGKVVDEWVSTDKAHEVKGLVTGKKYTLHEEIAPDGYAVATDTEFVLKEDGSIDSTKTTTTTQNGVLVIKDDLTSVKISKVDVTNNKELAGATIQILDENGKVVDEWVSTDKAHEVKGLVTGRKYTLHETIAPDGFAVATDTVFVLNADGTISSEGTTATVKDGVLVVEDDLTRVKISKVDVTNDEELEGAHIQIIDEDGKVVDEWSSEKKAHEVEGLVTGKKYTLRETVAPDGYTITTDTTFTLKADGTVDSSKTTTTTKDGVLLVEDTRTKVKISKVDVTSGEELEGAHIEILDENGNVVDSWVSGKIPHEVEGLVAGKKYTLRETVAPDGYDIAADTVFYLNEDGTIDTSKTTTTVQDGILLVEDAMFKAENASLAVTKSLNLSSDNSLLVAADQTFYVALYADAELTKRISDVKELVYHNEASETVVFDGLDLGRTYYVGECTEDGVAFVSSMLADGTAYAAIFNDGNSATVKIADDSLTVSFENQFAKIPNGFYREAELTLVKQLFSIDETPKNSDDVFYAGIFADEEHAVLSDMVSENIVALALNGDSEASATIQVGVEEGSSTTLYVAEVDANGTPLETSPSFEYNIAIDAPAVTLQQDETATVTIKNTEIEVPYGFNIVADLTVTKRLLAADGAAKNSNETFYAGIFADAAHTTLSDMVTENIVALALGGGSEASVTVGVALAYGSSSTTLYVTEVDANGTPVTGAASFAYDVTVDKTSVTLESGDEVTVTITNKERAETESEKSKQSETTAARSVQTGDSTPIMPYLMLMLAAAFVLTGGELRRRRNRANR